MKKFLVISPHPDDLDFTCAGTIAKLVKKGRVVEELIVTDGSKGSHVVGFHGLRLVKIREIEQRKAAKVLGVKNVYFLHEVDGEVENTKALRRKLVKMIRKLQPDVMISPDPVAVNEFVFPGRSHRDHRQVAEAVFDALYPAAGSNSFFPELLKQKLQPHQVQELWFFAPAHPNHFENITETLELKIKALLCHKSQIRNRKNLATRIRRQARALGRRKNMKYAEVFRVLRLT